MALIRWPFKYVSYWGYPQGDFEEFYDLENDPEETANLVGEHPAVSEYRSEMEQKRQEVDAPFQDS